MPSLSKRFDKHIEVKTDGEEPKEAKAITDEEIKKLHSQMDNQFNISKNKFDQHDRGKDMDAYWDLFSKCVEKGWLTYRGRSKEFAKAMKGRGTFTIVEKKGQAKRKR